MEVLRRKKFVDLRWNMQFGWCVQQNPAELLKITQGLEKQEGHTDYQYSSQCSDTK